MVNFGGGDVVWEDGVPLLFYKYFSESLQVKKFNTFGHI